MHWLEIRKHRKANHGFITINEFFLLLYFSSFLAMCHEHERSKICYSISDLSVPTVGGLGKDFQVYTDIQQFVT